jgi:acetyl esterase/lipase
MSWLRQPLNLILRFIEKPFLSRVEDIDRLRRGFEVKARLFFPPLRGLSRVTDSVTRRGLTVPVCRGGTGAARPVLLYLHGGAYVFGSSRTHLGMVGRLARDAGVSVVLPDYRLAPEHPFPAALEDALAVYEALAETAPQVVIGGDSAGGGLALALLAEILRLGMPRPLGCFAFSPLTDLSFSGDSVVGNARRDVLLPAARTQETAEMYLQGADPRDPRASPLFADFRGAPAVWLSVGAEEILLDDTRRMADLLRGFGVPVEDHIRAGLPHVWPFFHPYLPEARETLRDVANWINSLSRTAADS